MDKRFQIFISSTFQDLVDERQAVLKGVLELDHMPAGMELFPATDSNAWQLITDVIDSSDYYVLIVGGRYGSLDSEGISYTEKEYDYAVAQKKPVIALLHSNPDNLPRERTETDPTAWQKLTAFRAKVENTHACVYWDSADVLKAKLIVSLTSSVKRYPAVGWVRADEVPKGSSLAEVLALKNRVEELELELRAVKTSPPVGSEELMGGEDQIDLQVSFNAWDPEESIYNSTKYKGTIKPTWNEIFAGIAPALIDEASNRQLRSAFNDCLTRYAIEEFRELEKLKGHEFGRFSFQDHEFDTCVVQLRALGLIEESKRKRSVRDKGTYWSLTAYGDQSMVQLRAIRRVPPNTKSRSGSLDEEVSVDKGA